MRARFAGRRIVSASGEGRSSRLRRRGRPLSMSMESEYIACGVLCNNGAISCFIGNFVPQCLILARNPLRLLQ